MPWSIEQDELKQKRLFSLESPGALNILPSGLIAWKNGYNSPKLYLESISFETKIIIIDSSYNRLVWPSVKLRGPSFCIVVPADDNDDIYLVSHFC